ncbi:unnamed protein product [Cuscuta campestris]|uniref:Uncharacterized protein n=2 Tax=Cuscuta sect. Cleistogrammica TaxID=1824901 RepID=A0A484NI56_9ASTE|nr:hypothetical protein DM860_001564 [Cuscuta australis]VFR01142.1 unnamed protein product [Cuscuta campestris]
MLPQPRRKKWSEAEERTLIDKYGDMLCDGTLAKMKTREKKYIPIALHVNSVHHLRDPVAYPWQWTWKDVSTKVQNMRHQYALVKQKIKKEGDGEEFDWGEGLAHWSNFLRYDAVFGDVVVGGEPVTVVGDAIENSGGFDDGIELVQFGHLSHSGDFGGGIDGVENDGLGLGFDYDGEGVENYNNTNNGNDHSNKSSNPPLDDGENDDGGFVYEDIEPIGSDTRKKRKALKAWGFLSTQLAQLKEMETRYEQREVERERERQRRESARMEMEKRRERKREEREREREKRLEEMRRKMLQEWETMEKESEERERRRLEEASMLEREREERMGRRRSESKKRIDEMVSHHRGEMNQIQSRALHEQQSLTGHLLGVLARWTGHPTALPDDHAGATNHYLSQMIVNDMMHGDAPVEGDHQEEEDHFIVDG